jgi:hypothetical protein
LFAAAPASFMDSMVLEFKVPMFKTTAFCERDHVLHLFFASAITGEAPKFFVMSAQSPTVT